MVVTAAALLLQKLAKTWIWLTKISCSRLPADLLALLHHNIMTHEHTKKKIVSIINQRISTCLAFSPSSFLLNNHAIYFHCGALVAVDQSWGQSCSDDFKRHFTDVKLSVSPQLLSVCYFSDSTVVVGSLHRLIKRCSKNHENSRMTMTFMMGVFWTQLYLISLLKKAVLSWTLMNINLAKWSL